MENDLKIAYSTKFVTIRPDLRYSVKKVPQTEDMEHALLYTINKITWANTHGVAIIVYFLETTTAEHYQQKLQESHPDFNVYVYHGKMNPQAKQTNQDGFMEGNAANTTIMCCTVAFALGIDNPNVKSVIQFGICDSILDYAQAAGRAKRDPHSFVGPAKCVLITCDDQMEDVENFRLKELFGDEKQTKKEILDDIRRYEDESIFIVFRINKK